MYNSKTLILIWDISAVNFLSNMNVSTTPKDTSHEVTMLAPDENDNAVIQGQQQQQQSQQTLDPEQAVQQSADRHPAPSELEGLITQQLFLILHAHRCRRKDQDAMSSGGTVQPVSRFYL